MNKISSILVLAGLCFSCRQPYDPPVVVAKNEFLVVEANLNPGPDAATVALSRTAGLDTRTAVKRENNAQVTVEGKDNSLRQLTFMGSGFYSSTLNLTIGNEYRLRIKTTNGKEYLSEYVKAKRTLPIDSITWDIDDKGLRVYANTKDPSGNSRYYRWDYDETWEIRSLYFSDIIYEAGRIRQRVFPAEDVSVCWKNSFSTSIALANTARLQDDIVHKAPLLLIPPFSEKLEVRYSILVRQYVLDRQAYNFFEIMKKNTEEIGTIFGPQPSEVRGNITSVTDPAEYVLGYVTSSSVEQKRIFIQVPWTTFRYCPEIKVPNRADSLAFYFGSGNYIPYLINDPPITYFGSLPECVDCRKRGGSRTRPSFLVIFKL